MKFVLESRIPNNLHLKAAKFVFCGLRDLTILVLSTGDFSTRIFWNDFMFCSRNMLPLTLNYDSGDI